MTSSAAVPLPACGPGVTGEALTASIDRWVSSAALLDLARAFGGEPGRADPLGWLLAFSQEHWDFRRAGALERDQVAPRSFDPALERQIRAVAAALGMVIPLPPAHRRYQHLLILGGLARACVQRPAFAAHLVRGGTVEVDRITALASLRPIGPHETVDLPISGCDNEFGAIEAGVRRAFGFGTPERSAGDASWAVRGYRAAGLPPVEVLAAPSSQPGVRRANTHDTYAFWAKRVELGPDDRVLVITTPIYVPFQHCDAVRTIGLPFGCEVETIGFDPAAIAEKLPPQTFGPERYLQEIRSAILSMWALRAAVAAGP